MNTELLARLERDGIFPAHIQIADSGFRVQTVQEHCLETAQIAKEALEAVGLGKTGYLAGFLHDCGKQTPCFRAYLVEGVTGGLVHRGSVNHTFAGVRLVLAHLCNETTDPMARIAAEHIAFAIGGHHGLFDLRNPEGESGFQHRINKADPIIDEGIANFLAHNPLSLLKEQLKEAGQEIASFYSRFSNLKERHFYAHLVSRLLLSAVIDGDRKSTAEFEAPGQPRTLGASQSLWEDCLLHLEEKLNAFEKTTAVQWGRSVFSEGCRQFAENPGGIYRLNIPTGGGKTLSSLRYALAHSKKWDKQHIFFVMPLLAIIDQNAEVLRRHLSRGDIVLEHHSNIVPTEESQGLDQRELLTETWDAPVVITTLVQLLNTMFSHKTTSVRRFHNLCNSVIVIDEVQTVPTKLLSLFNQAISFLADACGATVILCSATQPALEYAQRPLAGKPADVIPYEESLWEPFLRTRIQPTQSMDLEEIAAFAAKQLAEKQSLLIICNKKAQAAQLYHLLQSQEAACFHFSASMCMAHRRQVLSEMEQAKKTGKVLCISTQVMEAGIDISFQCVIRLMAGMDSVIQAAGRCNRNRESETPETVYVIPCIQEGLGKLAEIKAGKKASRELFALPMEDYSSAKAIETYYRIYYHDQAVHSQDFYCKPLRKTLYELLSRNQASMRADSPYFLNQAYKTAGIHFQVFDENTVDAVVPYSDGAAHIQKLAADDQNGNFAEIAKDLEALKPYTISLYQYQRETLESRGALQTGPEGILVLDASCYDDTLGLVIQPDMTFLEV